MISVTLQTVAGLIVIARLRSILLLCHEVNEPAPRLDTLNPTGSPPIGALK